MGTNLALVSLDDLEVFVAKQTIKNEVWSSKQAADYLGCSVAQVKKQASEGIIPGAKIGVEWKFSSIALFEYVSKMKLNR